MGKGNPRGFRARPPRLPTELSRRLIQSEAARSSNVRRARDARNRRIRHIKAGKGFPGHRRSLIIIIENYLNNSGISGTAGEAGNYGQALGGAIQLIKDLAKKRGRKYTITPKIQRGMISGIAFVENIPDSITDDSILANLLNLHYMKITYEWESSLLEGKYTIYALISTRVYTAVGNRLIYAIATERHTLQKFRFENFLVGRTKISEWKKIRGRQPLPRTKSAGPKYSVIKQG